MSRSIEHEADLATACTNFQTDLKGLIERFGPESFGSHEMVDRAYIQIENWDYVKSSPATLIDNELYEAATKIEDLMADFYQLASRKGYETSHEK